MKLNITIKDYDHPSQTVLDMEVRNFDAFDKVLFSFQPAKGQSNFYDGRDQQLVVHLK